MTGSNGTRIAILGTGRVGTNLGLAVDGAGATVVFGARDTSSASARAAVEAVDGARAVPPADAVEGAELTVLAVPYGAVVDTLDAAGDLSRTIVVDATNPLGATLPRGCDSVLDVIAAHRPDVAAVKAFNSIAAGNYPDPVIDGRPAFLPVAGPAPAAERVAELARSLGFDALVIGDRAAAPMVEDFARLYIHLAFSVGLGGEYAFARVTRAARG